MPSWEAFVPSIAIGLVLLIMLWFALGTQRNIRKGNDLLTWLQGGLPIIGRKTTMRWLGSSVLELGIREANDPFRDVTVMMVLEPRDVSVLWAWARWRGRRDFMIVRANLRRAPRFSLDVGNSVGWTGRLDEATVDDGLRQISWPGATMAFAAQGADDGAARVAWNQLLHVSDGVWRLTVQPVVPHLEIHLRPAAREGVPAQRVLEPIRELAVALTRERAH
jgi:hypothetical protein